MLTQISIPFQSAEHFQYTSNSASLFHGLLMEQLSPEGLFGQADLCALSVQMLNRKYVNRRLTLKIRWRAESPRWHYSPDAPSHNEFLSCFCLTFRLYYAILNEIKE